MIARSMTLAAQFTRAWAALYTAGLPDQLGSTRRDELESDLWEQELAGVSNGEAFARLLFGMPSDLSWRLQKKGRKSAMIATLRHNWLGLLVAGFAGAALIFGTAIFIKFVGDDTNGTLGALIYGVGGLAGALMMVVGFVTGEREPLRGTVLLSIGTLTITAIYFWMFFIYVPLALVIVVFGILRARRFAREQDRREAA
jgi:hypothetical protein